MKISPSLRRLLPWAGAILLSVAVALGIIEATRLFLEHRLQRGLGNRGNSTRLRSNGADDERQCHGSGGRVRAGRSADQESRTRRDPPGYSGGHGKLAGHRPVL